MFLKVYFVHELDYPLRSTYFGAGIFLCYVNAQTMCYVVICCYHWVQNVLEFLLCS